MASEAFTENAKPASNPAAGNGCNVVATLLASVLMLYQLPVVPLVPIALHSDQDRDRPPCTRVLCRCDDTLLVGVTNLTDEQYVNHLNAKNPFTGSPIPEPGRVFFSNLSVTF